MKPKKIFYATIIACILLFCAIAVYLARPVRPAKNISWGVTFSQKFTEMFDGIDWRENYISILDDLGVKKLRLAAYWDYVEPEDGSYQFSNLDWQIDEAHKRKAGVILAVGQKLPRWPECHTPLWASKLLQNRQRVKLIEYVAAVVRRYNTHPAVTAFQIENEPFLSFGECPKFSAELLDVELSLARLLTQKPIVVTDSGELSLWYRAAKRADIFGTTMYRQVHSDFFGETTYPIPAAFFRLKTRLIKLFPGMRDKKFVVIELQAEPWMKKQPYETYPEQLEVLDIEKLKGYIDYAVRAGFDEYYLWGAEWWYWLKETKNHPEFWEYVKRLSKSSLSVSEVVRKL